jgi:hypothetical protein
MPRPERRARAAPRFTEAALAAKPVTVAPPPIRPAPAASAQRLTIEGAAALVQPAPQPAAPPRAAGLHVGTALTPQEIQGILAHAGSGCPLGPCLGCRHHDVESGACTA